MTLIATVVSGVALLVGATLLVLSLERSLLRTTDQLARSRAVDLAAAAAEGRLPVSITEAGDDGVAQVVDADGRVLAASANVTRQPPVVDLMPAEGRPQARTVVAPDDDETERYRVWAAAVPGGGGAAYVGTSLESIDEASRSLRRALLVGCPVIVGLVALTTWLLTGRTLRPVEDLRATVSSITETGLDRRLTVPTTRDEIARLAVTMNQMLGRLEDASRRQRDFVADASHELLSPLGSLRSQLEVGLAVETPAADWPSQARGALADVSELEQLVRDLLYLARDPDAPRPDAVLVDLDDLVLEEAARLRLAGGPLLDTSGVSAATVRGRPEDLRRLVRNLTENAVRHADGSVLLGLTTSPDGVLLVVQDDGPGVPSEDRDRVFDRFFTGHAARTRTDRTGLGLAIVRAVARDHGGEATVVARTDRARGARFEVRLPAA